MNRRGNDESMGKEDRMKRVLDILTESGYALPVTAIYRNAKYRGATFERRSTDNYLEELAERGYVSKIDPDAFARGEIVEIPLGDQGYWIATEKASEFDPR